MVAICSTFTLQILKIYLQPRGRAITEFYTGFLFSLVGSIFLPLPQIHTGNSHRGLQKQDPQPLLLQLRQVWMPDFSSRGPLQLPSGTLMPNPQPPTCKVHEI
jgi:hypothetical protein